MMKTKAKVSLLITMLVLLVGLNACGQDDANKIDLPSSANAVAQTAQNSGGDSAKNGTNPSATSQVNKGTAVPAQQKQTAGIGARRFSGSFEPQRSTDVAASVPGIIREVYVKEGDRVEKGAKLINIDGEDYSLRVAQAQAGLKAAETAVETIQIEVDRALKLRNQEAVAASMVDQLNGQLAGAKAQVEVARVGVRMANKARGDALIRAPYDGVVTAVNVAAGNYAGPGPGPLVRIEETQNLYLRVHVPEEYSRSVRVGSKLSVRVPALEKTMELTVSRVNPTIAGHSRAYDVLAEVENSNLEIQSGMFAEVTLVDGNAPAKDEASK